MNFETLVERLHINPLVLNEINSWESDTELSKLLKTFRSAKNQERFLDHYAEVMVARYFISHGCKLEVEVRTPHGRRADLRVTKDHYNFFVHIKRLNLEGEIQKELRVNSRLKNLHKISRTFNFSISLLERLTDKEMQEVYRQSKRFIQNSQIGDKRNITSSDGKILAECEIFPKFKGKSKNIGVYVLSKLWASSDRERFSGKLSEAYEQFMPESLNVILVTSRLAADFDSFEKALLDSTGFWSNEKHPDSYMIGWFNFGTDVDCINFRIWYRDRCKIPVEIRNIYRDYPFSDGGFMNISKEKPEDVIKPEFFEKYKELHEDIGARLIHTNTTITILEKILQYPFKYFSASQTIFWRTIFWNFAWVSVILIHTLTDDKGEDVHTLPKFKNKVLRSWLKDTEKAEFSRILKEHNFDPTTKNILGKIANIRKYLMAHRLLDKFDHLLHSKAVTVSEIRYAYNNIEKLFLACSFGIEYDTSLRPMETENINHILDLIIKASLWLNQPELMGEQWPNIRQDTSEEELRDLNTWRKKFSLPPD